MTNVLKLGILEPVIERRLSRHGAHSEQIEIFGRYFENNKKNKEDKTLEKQFYKVCADLLSNRDSERLLLYLPLSILNSAPESFYRAYMDAWYRLLHVYDVRENFHLGDCFELDARPRGGLERVVKCAHLTPWLLRDGFISVENILDILECNRDDLVLLQSFKDTWGFIREKGIPGYNELYLLEAKTARLPERKRSRPLYVSKKRQEWLNGRNHPVELLTPYANLMGPFSENIETLMPQLEEILARLDPKEIVLVGGSQLKGYGTKRSDLDVWNLKDLEMDPDFRPGSPHAAHIYLNSIWLGGTEVADSLEQIADRLADLYASSPDYALQYGLRRQALERLESDLLQYRLLHKGFVRFTGRNQFPVPEEMDGDCPFYDDEYRKIATMLFVKYVWL